MRMNIAHRLAALALLTLLASGAAVTGCGGASIASVCDDQCTCRACTDAEHQKCVDSGEEAANQADALGCSGPFDDLVSCFHENASCNSSVEKSCDAEFKVLDLCTKKK